MKTIRMMRFMLALSATPLMAQAKGHNPFIDANKVVGNYAASLGHHNEGVVESAIFQVLKLKQAYPEMAMPQIRDQLSGLALHGASQAIRYKAFIALAWMDQPEALRAIDLPAGDADAAFRQMADELERELRSAEVVTP